MKVFVSAGIGYHKMKIKFVICFPVLHAHSYGTHYVTPCFVQYIRMYLCMALQDELKTLKRAFNSVSLELAEGKGKMQHMEEHLRASISAVKSKEEECYTFEVGGVL